jgi:hypothetical protein
MRFALHVQRRSQQRLFTGAIECYGHGYRARTAGMHSSRACELRRLERKLSTVLECSK